MPLESSRNFSHRHAITQTFLYKDSSGPSLQPPSFPLLAFPLLAFPLLTFPLLGVLLLPTRKKTSSGNRNVEEVDQDKRVRTVQNLQVRALLALTFLLRS